MNFSTPPITFPSSSPQVRAGERGLPVSLSAGAVFSPVNGQRKCCDEQRYMGDAASFPVLYQPSHTGSTHHSRCVVKPAFCILNCQSPLCAWHPGSCVCRKCDRAAVQPVDVRAIWGLAAVLLSVFPSPLPVADRQTDVEQMETSTCGGDAVEQGHQGLDVQVSKLTNQLTNQLIDQPLHQNSDKSISQQMD